MPETETTFSAWNPGLEPEIPRAYLTLETIHRPENVTTALADVSELSTLTGLNAEELVAFRPERLMLHELIVRITADIVVQEGESEEALGLLTTDERPPHLRQTQQRRHVAKRVGTMLHHRLHPLLQGPSWVWQRMLLLHLLTQQAQGGQLQGSHVFEVSKRRTS